MFHLPFCERFAAFLLKFSQNGKRKTERYGTEQKLWLIRNPYCILDENNFRAFISLQFFLIKQTIIYLFAK